MSIYFTRNMFSVGGFMFVLFNKGLKKHQVKVYLTL